MQQAPMIGRRDQSYLHRDRPAAGRKWRIKYVRARRMAERREIARMVADDLYADDRFDLPPTWERYGYLPVDCEALEVDAGDTYFGISVDGEPRMVCAISPRPELWELWDLPTGEWDGTETRFDWTSDRDTANALLWDRMGF